MRRSDDAIRLAHCGVNPETIRRLVAEEGSGGAVERLRRSAKTHPQTNSELMVPAERRLPALAERGARLVFDEDPEFPGWLRELPDHPLWLFVRGALPGAPGVAVVGSRRATRYGLGVARSIGRTIGRAGWVVVSGLAAGVDTAAHQGVVDIGGRTTAVLGSGIDVWYPKRNRGLGEQMLDLGGCVVSEFPPATSPEPWRFPARNRIISGLVSVVIVVEAAVKSGALITARLALEHDRFVMAVPGDLDRETSAGTNMLLRDGAHPVTDLDELVSELELILGPAPRAGPSVEADHPVLAHLGTASLGFEELAARAGLSLPELIPVVADLEIRGLVTQHAGLVYPVDRR